MLTSQGVEGLMNLLKIKYMQKSRKDLDEAISLPHLGRTVATYRPYSEVLKASCCIRLIGRFSYVS